MLRDRKGEFKPQILPKINDWQSRSLNFMYPFVFMDAINYKVREDNHIVSKAAYVVLGISSIKDLDDKVKLQKFLESYMLYKNFTQLPRINTQVGREFDGI